MSGPFRPADDQVSEMQEGIVAQGVELMLYGMGTVVLFLTLLIVATTAMSRLLARYFPEAEPVPAQPGHRAVTTPAGQDPNLVAAITAAIHQHRNRRR